MLGCGADPLGADAASRSDGQGQCCRQPQAAAGAAENIAQFNAHSGVSPSVRAVDLQHSSVDVQPPYRS